MRGAGLLLVILVSTLARAGPVIRANQSHVETIIDRDEEGFSACGTHSNVAIVGDIEQKLEVFSFGVTLRAKVLSAMPDAAMVKAGKEVARIAKGKAGALEPTRSRPTSFWLAKAIQGKPVITTSVIPAEDPGFILGRIDSSRAIEALFAIAAGHQMHFALRYKEEAFDRVLSFTPDLTEAESTELVACIMGLIERTARTARDGGALDGSSRGTGRQR